MTGADEWNRENANPMFDRMTDGEIAAYFDDRDREPSEPDWDAIAYAKHSREAHDGKACDCPPERAALTGPPFADDEEPPF